MLLFEWCFKCHAHMSFVFLKVPWPKPFVILQKALKVGSLVPWVIFHREWHKPRWVPAFAEDMQNKFPSRCWLQQFNKLFWQVAAVSAFAQTLRRYTSLNHLAQAARAVLQNTSQINQMLNDLNRVDFANVQVKQNRCFSRNNASLIVQYSRLLNYFVISIKAYHLQRFI